MVMENAVQEMELTPEVIVDTLQPAWSHPVELLRALGLLVEKPKALSVLKRAFPPVPAWQAKAQMMPDDFL